MKVEKLTLEQEAAIPDYIKSWIDRLDKSAKLDREAATQGAKWLYKFCKLKEPLVVFVSSPMAAQIAAGLFKNLAQVRAQVWAQVRDQVLAQVGAQVLDQVWDQVGDQVWAQVWAQVRDQVGDQVYRAGYGSHDSGWLSFYSFFLSECAIEDCNKLQPLMNLTENCGWFWPFENAVIFTERPKEIHLTNKKLHKDGGPAILYKDGFSVHALNGVRVTKEIAETPGDKLSAELVLKEKNAEIRREIVRKIGTERLCNDLDAKIVDEKDDYQLLELDLQDGRRRPYLKMKNPSIDAVHIEGVHPDIKTVYDALAWRNGTKTYIKPKELT